MMPIRGKRRFAAGRAFCFAASAIGLISMAMPASARPNCDVPDPPPICDPRPRPKCTPPSTTSLNVTLRPQQTGQWCWAASGQMVMEYLGSFVAQCTQANNRLGRNDCCNNPTPAACVQPGWPEFTRYGFNSAITSDTALPWSTVRAHIAPTTASSPCRQQPFAFSWHWVGGGGHMMVARGYQTQSGTNWVQINDPWSPNVGNTRWITYDWYVAGANDHTHWNDYYNFTR
jgi:hypothetical protein